MGRNIRQFIGGLTTTIVGVGCLATTVFAPLPIGGKVAIGIVGFILCIAGFRGMYGEETK